MNKTIENLKTGYYSVVDSQGVSVTEHFIDCLEKEFADHDKQLCQKIINTLADRAELVDFGGCAEFMFTTYDLEESINEILRGDK